MGETFVRCVTGCTTGPVVFADFMEVSECEESRNTTRRALHEAGHPEAGRQVHQRRRGH